jgi:putative Ca2+/H+ antiporter (TMEM165/GDT1 family)
MAWQLLGFTFLAVFLSEMGDKSHLAAIALGGSSRFPLMVFLGTSAALVLSSYIGVAVGDIVADYISPQWLKLAAAIGFSLLGVRLLFWPSDEAEDEAEVSAEVEEVADPSASPKA